MTIESNPPLTESTNSLLELVRQAKDVLIGTHLNPDGDAIGSALAVSLWLDKLGVDNEVLCHNGPPGYLQFLPGVDRVRQTPSRTGHDLAIVLDLDALDRLGSCRAYFEAVPKLILIDHHQPHEMPGDLRIVDATSPATGAILCEIFAILELQTSAVNNGANDQILSTDGATQAIDADIAECLLTGLVTDTGSFRYPNTTAHSLHQAAWLIEHGANLFRVTDECYLNRDEQAVLLLREALNVMKTDCDGRLAWAVLPTEMYTKLGAQEEHSEGIVNEILSARKVKAAFVLRAGKFGKVKGSLRSKGDLDVAKVAQGIGGGGHKNAAGVTLEDTLEGAEATLVEALKEALGCQGP